MNAVSTALQSSQNRPLRVYMRPDLVCSQQVCRNEVFWLIKDPVELEFYRLNEEEFFVLQRLDGQTSLAQIKQRFEIEFAPQRIRAQQLQSFISDLQKKSLVGFVEGDLGPELFERKQEKDKEKRKAKLMSVLALKWRGVDPERFLNVIAPGTTWFFSMPAVLCSIMLMALALLWTMVNFETFVARLPDLAVLFAPGNWLLLGGVILIMKILHEFGHALCFKRFGGECHEIGAMLLALVIPTLYCNTSDSWLLKSKWRRAAIGAAGMYVELVIASIATFVWWFTAPGTFNLVCLNIMVTGTISVVLLNGNPFFKFDGYYIFSDLLELPNMAQRSSNVSQSWILKNVFGVKQPAEVHSTHSTRNLLLGYAVIAFAFKLIMMTMIVFMLLDVLNKFGLGYFGLAFGIAGVGFTVGPPLWKLFKFFNIPGRKWRVEMKHMLRNAIIVAGLIAVVFVIPFPHHIKCALTIEPHDAKSVYVQHDATLREIFVKPGQFVSRNQLIARLENIEKSLEFVSLQAEAQEYQSEIELIERTRRTSVADTKRLAELQATLKTVNAKLVEGKAILKSFDIIAPIEGQIIPEWIGKDLGHEDGLKTAEGSTLAAQNIGCSLPRGLKLCSIGNEEHFDAVLAINEHDVSFVEVGQSVTLLLDSQSGNRIDHEIVSVACKETDSLPGSLIKTFGGSIHPGLAQASGSVKPEDEHYEARVRISNKLQASSSGLRGYARIHATPKTLYERAVLLLNRQFRKKLN